ncbi:MAG: hypothetical protein LBH41_00560, partial [Rickettsiales bacterium]|nr:hypothetical protein [Rickettsiales bacterium]
ARSAGWGSEADAEMNGVVRDVWTRRDGAAMRDMLRNNRSARGEAGDSVRSNPFQRRLNDDGTVASRRGGRLDDVQTDCSRGEVLINTGAEQVCGRCDSHAQYNPASMQCVCRAGWTGDGMSCTATVDPGSCGQYAQYDVEKGACACRPGYGGDGITCRACHESASVDASGACACRPGYFGDGFSCESNCRPGFIANNSAFTCEPACPAGYRVQLGSN